MNLHDQFHNLHHISVTNKLRVSLARMICTTPIAEIHTIFISMQMIFFRIFPWRRFCDHLRIPRNVPVPGNFGEANPYRDIIEY